MHEEGFNVEKISEDQKDTIVCILENSQNIGELKTQNLIKKIACADSFCLEKKKAITFLARKTRESVSKERVELILQIIKSQKIWC